jgi:hypothetical protein
MITTTRAPVLSARATRAEESAVPVPELHESVRSLGECLAELSWTDPRWPSLGPSISVVADLVRRSVGAVFAPSLIARSCLRLELAHAGRGRYGGSGDEGRLTPVRLPLSRACVTPGACVSARTPSAAPAARARRAAGGGRAGGHAG